MIGNSIGRYHILEQLGEGGMAIVYKAYDTRLETDVAVKVIRTENLAPSILERALKRFEREAKMLAKLTHSNIVKVLDYGDYEGKPYLVMPYLQGGTLKKFLKGQPVPWQDAARLLLPIARALSYAHSEGMVHRDVKPSNILITKTGDPMLTDFGIAKIIDEELTLDLTGSSAAVGTPEYMAPEQVTSKSVDHRADIYALGVVFYEMVTGRKPFMADTPMAVLFKHASEPLPRPRSFVPSLPDVVEKVLLKALAKKKEDRYQSMTDFASTLEQLALTGRTIPEAAKEKRRSAPKNAIGDDVSTLRQTITPEISSSQQGENRRSNLPKIWQSAAMGIGITGICLTMLLLAFTLTDARDVVSALLAPETATVPASTEAPTAVIAESPTSIQSDPSTPTAVEIVAPPPTSVPPTVAPVSSGYSLEDCRTSTENICLYSISPQPSSVIVALKYKGGIDPSNLPYLTVNNEKFMCELLLFYPGRLYCSGSPVSGSSLLVLRYSENNVICSGTFFINEYAAPAPTSKSGSGGKYP